MKNTTKLFLRRFSIRSIPLVIFVILLSCAMNVYNAKLEIGQLSEYTANLQQQQKSREWNEVESIINLSNEGAYQNSNYLSQKIDVDLVQHYSDLDKLKHQFIEKKFDKDFFKILKNNTSRDGHASGEFYAYPYHTIIGVRDRVIASFSYDSIMEPENPNNEPFITWKQFVSTKPNQGLAHKAIDSVLNGNIELTFIQVQKFNDKKFDTNSNMNMDTLKKVFMKYGLKGLSHYHLISTAYISNDGDIFNNDDNTFMSVNKNYKLIIMQTFNLADIVDHSGNVLYQNRESSASDLTFVNSFTKYVYIKGFGWSFILFSIAITLMVIYNYESRKMREVEDVLEGDMKTKF